MTHDTHVEGRPMSEIKRLVVAEDSARFARLADVWNDLTVEQQEALVTDAEAMQSENEAGDV